MTTVEVIGVTAPVEHGSIVVIKGDISEAVARRARDAVKAACGHGDFCFYLIPPEDDTSAIAVFTVEELAAVAAKIESNSERR